MAAGDYGGAFSRLEWMVAGRYLRARRSEGAISVIAGFSLVGIMLGVATLIIVMSVMNGFRTELVDRILGAQPHISVLSSDPGGIADYDAMVARLRANSEVTRAAPILERQVMASSDAGNSGALIRGMRAEDLATLESVADPEEARGKLSDYGEGGVAVGAGLAQRLRLGVGDTITLISPRGLTTPFGVAPRVKGYRIAYIFRIGMSEYDRAFVFMPLAEAQAFFKMDGRVDAVEVMVARPDEVERIGVALAPDIGTAGYLWNWKRANSGFLSALDVERNVMFLILALIILVAALNIISGLIMLVKDKGRDIGILRTIGLPRGAVLRIFFICGASIGVVGTVLGVALGIAFTRNIAEIQSAVEALLGTSVWDPEIRMLTRVPAVMVPSDVVMTTVLALGLSFLATWYPAWRAARLDPVEALRYE
ncbi:lipoprotein-releasing ABC transporter permease subunit [Limibaculum sp. FT325]|uniref:lipoprotein-releasing ABC transporter permease subunit n=1 Tax=Thermohalobaculum sediminis TaxID=2939436 RepID=UPI0020BD7E18|nr:lipoprotein-releasing ABC transporter permease subunit [Limibaculum sediminis]MCL5778573.1 lipoprotein-releasing ABC transporter permease subunit [Limibaculum sediminis]